MSHIQAFLFTALCVLQLADVATTYYIISRQIGREANPLMAWLIRQFGLAPGLLLPKAAMLVALYLAVLEHGIPHWTLAGLIALYVWVIYNNVGVIRVGWERAKG
jgi:hypothetical protein